MNEISFEPFNRIRAISLNEFRDIIKAHLEHNHYRYCPESDSIIIKIRNKNDFKVSLKQAYYTNDLFDFIMNDNVFNEDNLNKDLDEIFICNDSIEWLYHNDPNMALELEYEIFR